MPGYGGGVTKEESRRTLSTAGAEIGPYIDLVRQAVEQNPDAEIQKFVLSANEVKDRRAHKRRFTAAAESLGYRLQWVQDPQKRISLDELWARIYKHGHEPAKRPRKSRVA
jgi:hypothetical protein